MLIVCYFVAYGFLLLLGDARFWDDWSSHSYNGVRFHSGQTFPFREYLDELTISATGGFWLYRPLTFFAYGASGIAVWGILGEPKGRLSQSERFWITSLFLLLPYNSVRAVVQALYSYTFSHLLFFVAWYLLVSRRTWSWFLLSWIFFVLSFPTHSLLFFVILPAVHCLTCRQFSWRSRLLRFAILGLTSLLYRPLTGEIWPNLRLNEGYNQIEMSFLFRALLVLASINGLSLLIAMRTTSPSSNESNHDRRLIATGLSTFSIGLFPYIAVGHFPNLSDFLVLFIPNFSEMDSRHSLLLPLGTAITVVGLVNTAVKKCYRNRLLGATIIISTMLCASIYLQYYTDGLKQEGIVNALRQNSALIPTRAVQFQDSTLRFNARGRSLYHWEYLGMLKDSGLGIDFEIMDSGGYPCDPNSQVSGTLVTINSTSGRLRTVLTGDAGVVLVSTPAKLCGPGLTALAIHKLQP